MTVSPTNTEQDERNEEAKTQRLDVDVEEANEAKGAKLQDNQDFIPFYKSPKYLAVAALLAVGIAIITLIPTVLFKESGVYSGPHFALSSDFTQESRRFQLARNGTRMFIDLFVDHSGVQIEVFDWEDGEWVAKSVLTPPGSETQRRLHKGDTSFEAFEVSDDGTRLAAFVDDYEGNYPWPAVRKMRVFEESVDGTEWFQVGETIDSGSLASLEISPFSTCRNGTRHQVELISKDEFTLSSISFSSDGNTVLVASDDAGYTYVDCFNKTRYERGVGAMQVFQHASTVSEERREQFANWTWIPKGQMLFGGLSLYRRAKRFAENAVMAGNAMRIISGKERVTIFDYDPSENKWSEVRQAGIYSLQHLKFGGDVFAMSFDGKTIAVAEANDSPSAYASHPYRGKVTIYSEKGTDEYGSTRFGIFLLQGENAFQHFGYSIALNGDYLVVGSENTRPSNFREGDKLDVFAKNATGFWNSIGPVIGHPRIADGWDTVAIGSDGRRIAGAGSRNIMVFDYKEKQ